MPSKMSSKVEVARIIVSRKRPLKPPNVKHQRARATASRAKERSRCARSAACDSSAASLQVSGVRSPRSGSGVRRAGIRTVRVLRMRTRSNHRQDCKSHEHVEHEVSSPDCREYCPKHRWIRVGIPRPRRIKPLEVRDEDRNQREANKFTPVLRNRTENCPSMKQCDAKRDGSVGDAT